MIKIGITGGIGSGKTVVTTLFEAMGIPVYIADEESKKLTNSSPAIRKQLIDLFGSSIYTSEGVDRKQLATYIFNDPERLKQVNAIIHPEVNRHFQNWVQQLRVPYCAIESAILFESGFDRLVDIRLMVYAPLEVRIQRVMKRDSFSREEIIRRINNQLADEIKKEYSDAVIMNDDKNAIIPQLTHFITHLQSL
ncbi:dephospho-CoA kinase [Parabacteroides sp. PF5-9]|uniref:dephospho-CoA kinase n=1 Tax=Parabacteroides sp. PF5-9 TaxID=1742404 RepID=UPI0024734CCE|nr:dephospho-CoA kinase [Parabacteroides sp. PF5-9]MDH6358974.1 dephospho-CoA kinase [Parabacteroides sp. PF5-9]